MKRIVLTLVAVPLLAFMLSSSAFAADVAIVACEVISEGTSSKTLTGQAYFQILVVSFSVSDDLPTVQEDRGSSCVKVLAKLVNNENFKIKGVSSTNNGRVYTLLWKE